MGLITNFFGVILDMIFNGVALFVPVGTLGITIILFTLVTRILMTPLQLKQQRSTRAMSRLQPEMQRIQKKYANKNDQASKMAYSQELQALYKKHNASPLAGCLPMLIQFPLIFALYNVLREPARHISALGQLYTDIADVIINNIPNYEAVINNVLEVLPLSSTGVYQLEKMEKAGDVVQLSDTLSHFTTAQWNELLMQIPAETQNLLSTLINQKQDFEWFLVNLIDSPAQLVSSGQFFALAVPVIAGASTFIYSKITMASNQASSNNGENPAEGMMKTMNFVMPIMMGFFAYTVPSGLALYWIAGNVIMLVQQMWVNKIVQKEEAIIEEKEQKERAAKKASKQSGQARPKKKRKPNPNASTSQEATKNQAKKPKPKSDRPAKQKAKPQPQTDSE